WLISHADDEGRLRGEPEYVKATVVPMKDWTFDNIRNYLIQMKNLGLIQYWENNGVQIIEFPKWKEHQIIRSDRFKHSSLPAYDNQPSTNAIPAGNHNTPQANISEVNKEEIKKSEISTDPNTYPINNEDEYAALEAWRKL